MSVTLNWWQLLLAVIGLFVAGVAIVFGTLFYVFKDTFR